MSGGAAAPVTAFWRLAGMSYLQYVTRASSAVRGALKEPAKLKIKGQEMFSYNVSTWQNGVQSAKTPIETLASAGK